VGITVGALGNSAFGKRVWFSASKERVAALSASDESLATVLCQSDGLLLIRGLNEITRYPELLLEIARLFGPGLESYRDDLTPPNMVHPELPQIFLVSNNPKVNRQPPVPPEPALTAGGNLQTQYPYRRGWHTDGSFRRPPPDVSLLYAVKTTPAGQGQTIYANATAAYESLPLHLKRQIHALIGLHIVKGYGRTGDEVDAGVTPSESRSTPKPQAQPVVRIHPITARKALYICDGIQMDFVAGPFLDMRQGPDSDGARLLAELLMRLSERRFLYIHEWREGDLLISDNRCIVHCATWFDAANYQRLLWRTTVGGNSGLEDETGTENLTTARAQT
jgi:taurine dioxygenase